MTTVSGTSIGPGGTTIGPYRATRLWNDVIRTIRSGMPTSRHRRQLRTYEDCFVATEAINWLHSHLTRNPNFGPEVTRIQTIQLLQKFKKAGVFQDVRGSKKEDFEDNGKLYKFAQTSPLKAVRTPLAVRTNAVNQRNDTLFIRPAKIDYEKLKPVTCIPEAGLPQCEVVTQRSLTAVEIENEYKNMTLNCLKKILGVESFEEILDTGWASGKTIMHNMTYVTKSGYVTNVDKKDHLPHWVLSAMRCLANWPNRIDDNIPDYVGFEKDVFKVVKDYFQGLKEPLLTYTMYDLITNVLGLFCLFDNEVHNKVKNALQVSCLLLPSGSRRKLHLLLRLMNKMVNNQDLSTLDQNTPVRTLILETFCRSILRCEEEADLDELLALRLVTFMVDNYEEIMKVPQELKNNIEERLVYLRRAKQKIRYTTDDFAPLTYCAQVTTREYETQRMSISQQAMADLLENIIKDKNMSQKDKKKKMKVFQKTYPDIYNRRFPTNESEAVVFKPKIKQPLLARPLQRLKTLRL